MSYRHRMQVKMDRRAQHTKQEREDRVMFAEPHLRDYEAAYFADCGGQVQAHYAQGWVYVMAGTRLLAKQRLQQIIAMTATLQAREHERVITNEGED